MSGRADVATRVTKIVAEVLACDDCLQQGPSITLRSDLGADSLDLVELAMAIEEDFGIEIPDDLDLEQAWPTVGDVIAYVEKATAGR